MKLVFFEKDDVAVNIERIIGMYVEDDKVTIDCKDNEYEIEHYKLHEVIRLVEQASRF